MGRKAGKKNLNKTPSSEKTTRRQSHIRNANACRRQTPQSGDSLAVHTLPRAASPPRTLWPLPWVSSRLIQERVLIARRLPLYPNSLPSEQPAFTCAASSPLAPAVSWETPEASPSWTLKRLQQRSAPWLEPSPHRASRRSPEDLLELWPQLSPPPSPPRSPPCSPRQPRRSLARNLPTRSPRPSAQRLQSPPQSPQRSPQTSPRQSGQRLPLRYPQRLPQQSSGHSAQNMPPHSHRPSPQPTPQNSSQLSLQQPPPYAPSPSPPPTPASSSHTSQARTPQKSPLLSPQQSVQRSPQLSPERTEQYSPQPSPQHSLQSFSEHRPSEQSLPLQKQSPALSLQSSSSQLPCQSRSESLFLTPPETPPHSPARFAPALEAEAARRPWPDQQRSGLTARAQKIARSPRRALRKLKRLAACSKGSLSSSSTRSNSSVRQQILGHILKEDSSWLTQSGAESVEEMVRSCRRQRPSPARLDHAHAHAKTGPRSKRAAELGAAAKATAPQESETPFEKPQKTETKAKVKVQGVAKKKVRTKTDKNETVQLNNSRATKSETVSRETEEVPCTKEMNAKKHDETKLQTELKAKPPVKTTSENKKTINATGESAIKIETAEDSKTPIGNCKANDEGATYAAKAKVSKAKATTETQTEAEAKAKGRADSKEALHRGVGPRVAVSLCDGRDSWPLRISQWHVSGHGQIVLSCSLSQHSQFGATPRHFECLPGLIMRGQMLAPSGMSLSTSSPSTPTLMSSIASTPSPYSALSHIPILPSMSSPTLAQQLPGAAFIPFASIPTAVALPVPFPAMSTATAQTAVAQTTKAPPPTSPVMQTPAATPTETPSVNPMPAPTSHLTAPPMPQTASMPTPTPDSKFINTAPLPSPSTPITPSYQVKDIPRRSKISGQDDLLVAKDKSTLPSKTHLTDSNMKTRHELNIGMLRIRQFLCDKKWDVQSNFTVDPRFVSLCRQPNGTHVTHNHKLDDNLIVGEEHVTPECSGKQELSKVYQKISNSKHSKEIQTSPSIRLQDISVTSDIREKRQDQRPNEYVKESPLIMSHTTRRAQRKSQFSPTRIQKHTSAVKRCAPNLSLGGKRHISIAPGIAKLHLRKGLNVDKRRVVRSLTGITQHSRSKLGPRSRLAHKLQPDGSSKRRSHKHTPADTSAVPEKKTPPAVSKRRARRDARRQDESPTNEPVGAKKTREARKKRILTTTTATSPIRKLRKTRRAQAVHQPAVDSAESIQSSCLSSGSSLAQPATGSRKTNHAQPSPSKAPQVKTTSAVTKMCRKSVQSEEDPTTERTPSTHRRQQLQKMSPTDCRKVPCIPEAATLRSRDGRREDGPRPPPSAARSDRRLATAGSPRDRSPPVPLQRLPSSASRPPTGTPRRGRTPVTADSRGAQKLASADQRQRYGPPSAKRARLNRTPSAASRRSHRSPSVDSRRLRVTPTRRYSTSARPSDISEETFARDQQQQQRFREPEDLRYADERHDTRSIPGQSAGGKEGRALYGRYDASPPPPPPSPAPAPPLHRRFAPALRQWPLLRRMRTALLSPLSCVKAKIAPSSTYTAGPRKDHKLRQYISETEA